MKAATTDRQADVFISHAHEDKQGLVQHLAGALRELGVLVWYDDFTLDWGDSLIQSVDDGLRTCRFGIVVLSPSFLLKRWPRRELDALATRELLTGESVILPIWHGVTARDVFEYSPPLADRIAVSSKVGISALAERVVQRLQLQPAAKSLSADERLWRLETAWLLPEVVRLREGIEAADPKSLFSRDEPATSCVFRRVKADRIGWDLLFECKGTEAATNVRCGFPLGAPATARALDPGETMRVVHEFGQDESFVVAGTWSDSSGRHQVVYSLD